MKATIALASALSIGVAGVAQAQIADGTITFTGEVLETTCVINAGDTGSTNATVSLPSVLASALANMGRITGFTPFRIVVGSAAKPCNQQRMQAFFHPGGNVNASGFLDNNGDARNVNVMLFNSQREPIYLNDNRGSETVPIENGVAELNFFGAYVTTTGGATPGSVLTSVEYTIVYP